MTSLLVVCGVSILGRVASRYLLDNPIAQPSATWTLIGMYHESFWMLLFSISQSLALQVPKIARRTSESSNMSRSDAIYTNTPKKDAVVEPSTSSSFSEELSESLTTLDNDDDTTENKSEM
jgi:hypothetical protein